MSRKFLNLSPNTKGKDYSPIKTVTLKGSLSELLNSKDVKYQKKSQKKSQKPFVIQSAQTENHHRKSSSVSKMKQVTVNQLLNKNELPDIQMTQRSEDSLSGLMEKWKHNQEKLSETLAKLSNKRLESLKTTISDCFFHCFSSTTLSSLSKLSVSDYFFSIFSSFRTVCHDLLSQKSLTKSDLVYIKEENLKLKEEVSKLKEENFKLKEDSSTLHQKSSIKSPRPIKLPKLQSIDKMKTQYELEKAKLLEKISILESHLSQVTSQSKSEQLVIELDKQKVQSESLHQKNEKLSQKIKTITYKFQCEIGEIKAKAKEDQEFVKKFTDVSANYENAINRLEIDKKVLTETVNRYRERLNMLSEEFIKLVGYREKYKKSQDLANSMKIKYNQLELELIAGSSQRKVDTNSWVSFNGPLFEKIRNLTPFPEQSFFGFDNEPSTFRLSCPTFAGLLDLTEENFIIENVYPNWLEVHIRGIYDSKYTEHLLCTLDSGRPPSRFPDFVFTWLGKFCIDDKTRQVNELEWWKKENIESIRVKFLSALKLANTLKVWELYTFKEFFLEDLLLDELSFFLHCRQLIFKGPQLELTQGKFSNLNYIDLEHLNSVIDSVLHKLPNNERLDIKIQIASKSKSHTSGNSIEAGFVTDI